MITLVLTDSKLRWAVRVAPILLVVSAVAFVAPLNAEPPAGTDTPLFSAVQATRGGPVVAAHCAVCHGSELTGGGGAPSLNGPDFLFGWSKKTTTELVEYIATNMPPGQGHSLPDRDYEDATAYILSVNGFPAGVSDLTPAKAKTIGVPPNPS